MTYICRVRMAHFSTNRFCRIVMDLKINIAYFPFQVNGIKVSLPNKDGSSNIEISIFRLKIIVIVAITVTTYSCQVPAKIITWDFNTNQMVTIKLNGYL
jgi:hypothetical protein